MRSMRVLDIKQVAANIVNLRGKRLIVLPVLELQREAGTAETLLKNFTMQS